jgi:tRNA1(Val) A37 N6-methylase TrmN6
MATGCACTFRTGLLPIEDPDPYWQSDYDLVIGNPPFAATGYRVRDPKILERFELAQEPAERIAGASLAI